MIRTQPHLRKGDCVWVRLPGQAARRTVLGEVRRAQSVGREWLVAIAFDAPLSGPSAVLSEVRRVPGKASRRTPRG